MASGDSLDDTKQADNEICVITRRQSIADDNLDLLDLWRVISSRQWVVWTSWLLAGIVATIYLLIAEPLYRSEARLFPPAVRDVQQLSVSIPGVIDLNYAPMQVYEDFIRNFESPGLQKQFFERNSLAQYFAPADENDSVNIDKLFVERFSKAFSFRHNQNDDDVMELGFEYSDPKLAAQWLLEYINFVNDSTIHHFYLDVNTIVQRETERYRLQIKNKRNVSLQRRDDEIARLREALVIAKALKTKGRDILPGMANGVELQFMVDGAEWPLYMRGEKALEKLIVVLETRKDIDAFVEGLRDIQEKLASLESISVNVEKLSAIRIDVPPTIPWEPIKPKKILVFALAFMVATFIGLCAVFLLEYSSRTRANQRQP
jgi:chain length determinant protein (polysaccharide antigen chain regulator)